MKIHLSIVRKNAFGGETTKSLCGRLNAGSADGMNLGGEDEVNCAFCLKLMRYAKRRAN